MTIDTKRLKAEINVINAVFRGYNVDAGTTPALTVVGASSLILYKVGYGRGVRIADVRKVLPELREEISRFRRAATPVRLRTTPLALEVPHPHPRALQLNPDALRELPAMSAALGRLYDFRGARNLRLDLADVPHVLIAGMTGSGKSTMLNGMLSSVTYSTSPADLRIVVVDLKNQDLTWCDAGPAGLPHVDALARSPQDAAQAVESVYRTMIARRDRGEADGSRVLLVVDELAQLADDGRTMGRINELTALGRALGVNLWLATQEPTQRILGKFSKANFGARLVGLVADASAASVATGRRETGAELLPGSGAFLRIAGQDVDRYQAFLTDRNWALAVRRETRRRWLNAQPVPVVMEAEPAAASAPSPSPAPVPEPRDEIGELADVAAAVLAEEPEISKSRLARALGFSQYGGSMARKTDAVLARLAAREGSTATTTSTTTAPRLARPARGKRSAWGSSSRGSRERVM